VLIPRDESNVMTTNRTSAAVFTCSAIDAASRAAVFKAHHEKKLKQP
jgi:hypothetical protein